MKKKKFTEGKIEELKKLKQWKKSQKCKGCGTKENLTLHHIIYKSLGGPYKRSNLMILCRTCHDLEHTSNHKKRWRNEDIETIMILKKQGYNYDQISEWIGRSVSSCTTMVHNIKMGVDNLSNELKAPMVQR